MDDEYINEKTKTLITDEWRITIFSDHAELFNLIKDPNEMNNLWNEEHLNEIKVDLLIRLMRKILKNKQLYIKRDCQY
jgi:hypothetical protein